MKNGEKKKTGVVDTDAEEIATTFMLVLLLEW